MTDNDGGGNAPTWHHVNINKNQIKHETARAYLVKMPHNSNYDGFAFWVSKKLARDGRHGGAIELSFTDSFTFKLQRRSDKTFQILSETEIDAGEMLEAFETTDANIIARAGDGEPSTWSEVETAPKIDEPDSVEVPDDLRN